jgi:trk system potassium uptake protein
VLVLSSLQEIGVPHIHVQVNKPREKLIALRLGATVAVFPAEEMGVRVAQGLALGGVLEAIPVGQGFSFASLRAPDEFVGRTIADIKLREKYRINIVTVFDSQGSGPGAKTVCRGLPTPDFMIEQNDLLYVFGHEDDLKLLLE